MDMYEINSLQLFEWKNHVTLDTEERQMLVKGARPDTALSVFVDEDQSKW